MARRARPIALARSFARAERGATAVEFAFVVVPLMVLIFGILETGLVMLTNCSLQMASEDASRAIRTGNFQQSGTSTAAAFENLVCSRMAWLGGDCASRLVVRTEIFSSYGALAAAPPPVFDPQAKPWENPQSQPFTPGGPCDLVLVRTYYRWQIMTPFMDRIFEHGGGGPGVAMLGTATAFRNEPWDVNPGASLPC